MPTGRAKGRRKQFRWQIDGICYVMVVMLCVGSLTTIIVIWTKPLKALPL